MGAAPRAMSMALGVRIRTAAATIVVGIADNYVRIKDPRRECATRTRDIRRGVSVEGPETGVLKEEGWPLSTGTFLLSSSRFPVSGLFRVT